MNKLFLTLFAIAGLLAAAWTAWAMDGYPADSKAVEEVLAGTRTEANVYYTGIQNMAAVSHEGGAPAALPVSGKGVVTLPVSLPARGFTWYTLR